MKTNAANNPGTVTRIREGPTKDCLMYDNRIFFSYQEVLCYMYLRGIGIPAKRMHMEYRVGNKHIDFFPLRRVFWEHHPILLKFGKGPVRYGEERRALLDAKGYSRIPLVVSCVMFKDQDDIRQRMSGMGVDFRTGKVPEPEITYIIKQREEMCIELLMEPMHF
jgi:hypothetical protein